MKKSSILFLCILIILGYFLYTSYQKSMQTNTQPSNTSVLGQRTKSFACQTQGALPDPSCTPGAADPSLTTMTLCSRNFTTKSIRNVTAEEKKQVFAEYGILSHSAGEYEVDHLISLELGGSNDIANLWPEAANPRPGFHEKDKVENYLHREVCEGMISLQQAQSEIAHNWLQVYNANPNL